MALRKTRYSQYSPWFHTFPALIKSREFSFTQGNAPLWRKFVLRSFTEEGALPGNATVNFASFSTPKYQGAQFATQRGTEFSLLPLVQQRCQRRRNQ